MINRKTIQKLIQFSLFTRLTAFIIMLLIVSATSKTNGQTLCQSTSGALPLSLTDFGQSVTMTGCTGGYFHSFAIEKDVTTSLTADITIFNGVSSDPSDIIYQQTGVTIPDVAGTPAIILSGGTGTLAFTANNQYTFRFETSVDMDIIISPMDNYVGGSFVDAGTPSSDDLGFELYTTASAPLPVELSYFEGYETNSNVNLIWATEMEKNNIGFYIQRATNGTEWSTIGFVDGNGTTTDRQEYSFIDSELERGNTYYYRLKQVDFDETYNHSDIISITYKSYSVQPISIYPNPVVNDLNIIHTEANGTIKIFDSLGQIIKNESINESESRINLRDLHNGVYFVQIQLEDGTNTVKQIIKK